MRLLLSLAAVLLLLGVAAGGAAAAPRSSSLAVAVPDRTTLAGGGALRIAVRAPRAGRHRIVVGLQPRRGRPLRARTLSVRVRHAGRRVTIGAALSRAARRRLAGCSQQTLTVRLVGRRGRTVVRVRRALAVRARCAGGRRTTAPSSSPRPGAGRPGSATGTGSPGAPGGASGSGSGGSGGGPTTPAEPAPEAPGFDTRDAGRCDPIDPSVCLQPFPNDHFTTEAPTPTGRRLNLQRDSMPANRAGKPIEPGDYNRSDGFSPGQMITVRVPGLDTPEAFRRTGAAPIDDPRRSLAADAPVLVLNADTGERHLVWAEIDSNPSDPAQRNLLIRPGVNFDEGARYVVALRNLENEKGEALEPGRAFRVYRDGIVTTDAVVERRRPAMEGIFATLGKAGVAREELYLAWDFTVASAPSTTGRLLSIRDRAFAELGDTNLADRTIQGSVPTYAINADLPSENLPSAPEPPGSGDFPVGPPGPEEIDGIVDYDEGPIARTVRGRLTVPCFLDQPGCPTGSRFLLGADGTPTRIPGNTTAYDFTCTIPRRPGKLRPGLYGHGLFGGQGEIFQGQLKALSVEHGFLFCAVDWNGMSTKDLPNTATVLQDLSRFPTLVDHVQQGYLGFLLLGRAMLHPDGFAKHPAFQDKIDTTALYYDGNSQGGIYGGALTAVAPDFERAVLGVPGMNYSTLLRRSTDFDMYANGDFGTDTEAGLYDNYPSERERPLVLSLIQILWDRGDPNGYAHHMTDDPLPNTPPHRVLLHVGFGDHQVADVTTEVQARTIGAGVHRPLLAPGRERFRTRPYPDGPSRPFDGVPSLAPSDRGSGVVFWDVGPPREDGRGTPPPHAANIPPRDGQDPHEYPRRTPAAREQKSAFLQPDGRIVDVCGGGPCYADAGG